VIMTSNDFKNNWPDTFVIFRQLG